MPAYWFYHPYLANFNLLMYILSIAIYLMYGDGSFKNVKITGPYHVASKDCHMPEEEGGNAATVFYPMDKHLKDDNTHRFWLNYRQDDKFIRGCCRANTWLYKKPTPQWVLYQWRNITIDVVPDGPLATDFATGKNKLIPIVFSHGLTASRSLYTVIGRELASHGYIVIFIDHHDGTCAYTEKKKGTGFEPVYFDSSVPWFTYKDMKEKTDQRVKEATKMITFVSKPKFL
jgi:hypothetical protein